MKKFIIALSALILLYLAYDTARYRLGWYIDLKPDEPVTAFMTTDTQSIYMDRGSGPEPFTVKGVNLGVGLPGEWATDYAIGQGDLPALVRADAGDGRQYRTRLHYAA